MGAFFVPYSEVKLYLIMKNQVLFLLSFTFFGLSASCQSRQKQDKENTQKELTPVQTKDENGLRKAYFASGCFWCVEAIYESLKGVEEAHAGYSGGTTKNPTYRNHGDHAETIEVLYNPEEISFAQLITVYFDSQNITQINGQGPDRGPSYRSIIFYQNQEEKDIIEYQIQLREQTLGNNKVAAQVLPFQKFWIAEDYHQDYEQNNPDNPYIQNVSIPRLNKFKEKHPDLLKNEKSKKN